MILKGALVAAAAVTLVALLTSKAVRSQRTTVLNGLKYELQRYSNDTVEVLREDGLRFTIDIKTGRPTLAVGTFDQMQDALRQVWRACLAEIPTTEARAP